MMVLPSSRITSYNVCYTKLLRERLAADLKQLCEYQIGLFGGRAPFDRYLFQIMVVRNNFV